MAAVQTTITPEISRMSMNRRDVLATGWAMLSAAALAPRAAFAYPDRVIRLVVPTRRADADGQHERTDSGECGLDSGAVCADTLPHG
jgi:hypothetical protein